MTASASRKHRRLVFIYPEGKAIHAVQKIADAYYSLNDADGELAYELEPNQPMTLLAKAAVRALTTFPGVTLRDAKRIWENEVGNNSGINWNYDLWRNGDI